MVLQVWDALTMFAIYPGEMATAAGTNFVLYAAAVTRYIYRLIVNFLVWIFPTLRAVLDERRFRNMEKRLSRKQVHPSGGVENRLVIGTPRLAAAAEHTSRRLKSIESNESFAELEIE